MINKMKRIIVVFFGVLFLLVNNIQAQNNKIVSVKSLLKEITDREKLTRFPEPAYLTKHVSSYDRSSTSPAEKNWFHNWDMNQWEAIEQTTNGKEYVLMDEKSPGAITRF